MADIETRSPGHHHVGGTGDARRAPGPSEEVVVCRAARAAEDEGDLAGAERLLSLLPADETVRRWRVELAARRRLSADAAPYRRGLCLLGPAQRWAAEGPARPSMRELAQVALRVRTVSPAERDAAASTLAAFDPLVGDVALFDDDMLSHYLQHAVDASLLLGCGPVDSWGGVPGAVFEVLSAGDSHTPARLRPTAPASAGGGATIAVVGPVGSTTGLVYGRAVPTGTGEHVFALPPVPLSAVQAGRVQRALLRRSPGSERVRLLARAAL